MRSDQLARRRIAFHEAGHAIVGWFYGAEIIWIRLIEEDAGRTCLAGAERLSLVARIAIAMGGVHSAPLSGVGPVSESEAVKDRLDVDNLTNCYFRDPLHLGFSNEPFCAALRRAGCARAVAIVRRHADLVALIAGELERRGEILAGEAARILPPSPAGSPTSLDLA